MGTLAEFDTAHLETVTDGELCVEGLVNIRKRIHIVLGTLNITHQLVTRHSVARTTPFVSEKAILTCRWNGALTPADPLDLS